MENKQRTNPSGTGMQLQTTYIIDLGNLDLQFPLKDRGV